MLRFLTTRFVIAVSPLILYSIEPFLMALVWGMSLVVDVHSSLSLSPMPTQNTEYQNTVKFSASAQRPHDLAMKVKFSMKFGMEEARH